MGALMMRLFSVRAGQCRDCSDKKFLMNCNTCASEVQCRDMERGEAKWTRTVSFSDGRLVCDQWGFALAPASPFVWRCVC